MAFVVFAEEIETKFDLEKRVVQTLEQAFAQIVCRCGLAYHFAPTDRGGWILELVDVAEPSRNPDPVYSSYKRMADAQHDLMSQAVDGRLRGHVVVELEEFRRRFIEPKRAANAV